MYRPLPDGLTIKNSPIEGLGLFTNIDIIPGTDNNVDLGSVDNKFRDVFISNNSLWIGDEHKLAISDNKMKFRKKFVMYC